MLEIFYNIYDKHLIIMIQLLKVILEQHYHYLLMHEKQSELKISEQIQENLSSIYQGQQKYKTSEKYEVYKNQFYPQIQDQVQKKVNFDFNNYKDRFQAHDIVYNQEKISQGFRIHLGVYSCNWRTIDILVTFSFFTVRLNIFNLVQKENFDLSSLNEIGYGSYGKVLQFSRQKQYENQHFAIKILILQQSNESLISLLKQVALIKLFSALKIGLSYKKLFQFDIIIKQKQAYISMEKGLSIEEYFENRFEFKQTLQVKLEQIQKSIKLMHSFGIVHMDIKSQNILYSCQFKKIVLIDFGLSQIKTIRPGMMEKQRFKGSYYCCSEQMQNLFYNRKREFLDVYYNDYVCWKKAKQNLLMQYKLYNEQIQVSKDVCFNQSITKFAFYKIEKYVTIFKTILMIKRHVFQDFCKQQKSNYLKFLKTNFQTIFFMIDEESQAFNFFNFIQSVDFQLSQDFNQLIKKRQAYNSQIHNQVCRIFQFHQQQQGYFKHNSSLAILMEDTSYSNLTIQQQYIILYRKLFQSKEFVSYKSNKSNKYVRQLFQLLKKDFEFLKNYCTFEQFQYFKVDQLLFTFNFLVVQSFVKVLSQFTVKKIIKNVMILSGKQHQLKNNKEFNFQLNAQNITKYSLQRFCCLVLLWREMSTINDVIKKAQILKILKGLINQCDQIESKQNKSQNYNKTIKNYLNIIRQWILQEYFAILLNHFFQAAGTKHSQIIHESFKQICQLQKSEFDSVISNAFVCMMVKYIKIVYQIQFIPISMAKQMKLMQRLKDLLFEIIKRKSQIIWTQFQNLIVKVLNTFISLQQKHENFQETLYFIKYCEKQLNFSNVYISQINRLKYKLAATYNNNTYEKAAKKNINFFNSQKYKKKPQQNQNVMTIKNKRDNYWLQKYQELLDQYKKQLVSTLVSAQTVCSISDRLKQIWNKFLLHKLSFEQKSALLQEYEKCFYLRKKQIQTCCDLVSFHQSVEQVKKIKILQIWSQFMIVLIQNQKQVKKVKRQRQLFLKFVSQNLFEDTSQFVQVDFYYNKKYQNNFSLQKCVVKYLLKFKLNSNLSTPSFYIKLLNQIFADPLTYLDITSTIDYQQLFFQVFDFLSKNKMIAMFFKYCHQMIVFSKNLIKISVQKIGQINQQNLINLKKWKDLLFKIQEQLCHFVSKYPCSNYSTYLIRINKEIKKQFQCLFKEKNNSIISLQLCNTIFLKVKQNNEFIQNQLFKSVMEIEDIKDKNQIILFMFTIAKVIQQKQKANLILKKIIKYIPFASYYSQKFILKSLYGTKYFMLKNDQPESLSQKNQIDHKRKMNFYLIKHLRNNNKKQIGQKLKQILKKKEQVSTFNIQKLIFRKC